MRYGWHWGFLAWICARIRNLQAHIESTNRKLHDKRIFCHNTKFLAVNALHYLNSFTIKQILTHNLFESSVLATFWLRSNPGKIIGKRGSSTDQQNILQTEGIFLIFTSKYAYFFFVILCFFIFQSLIFIQLHLFDREAFNFLFRDFYFRRRNFSTISKSSHFFLFASVC